MLCLLKFKTDPSFGFDFVPDTLKSPRHYIFDCYNPVIDYTYGHQAIILYNKKMVLENTGTGLDFTLSQQHDHVKLLSAETTFFIVIPKWHTGLRLEKWLNYYTHKKSNPL
jgi:hypothetical protein